jgi:ribosome-interacting GTPase 1
MTKSLGTIRQCGSCAGGCPTAGAAAKTGNAGLVVALAGNPNTGKSTIFNQLTGLRQHAGNWAGKTVARAGGSFEAGGKKFRLVDLPACWARFERRAVKRPRLKRAAPLIPSGIFLSS